MFFDTKFIGKSILITGGTGSFGQAFVAKLLSCPAEEGPRRVIVFSRDEYKQSVMADKIDDPRLRFFLGDVRDKSRLERAFIGVDHIVHAAALKQVPAAEYNPFEAVKTNVIGAQNVIDAAIDTGVQQVIALSTDKAVSPANLYGATKLCSDRLFIAANAYSPKTRFSVVRYGNVACSRGSVIQLFRERAADMMSVPITDPRMTRFWLTLEQATTFVLQTYSRMRGGEVFVPKLPSVRVVDIAKAIAPKCQQVITGIRPGEKLHEALIAVEDARHTLDMGSYYIIQPSAATDSRQDWGVRVEPSNVPEGFIYTSDTNEHWLTEEEIWNAVETAICSGAFC